MVHTEDVVEETSSVEWSEVDVDEIVGTVKSVEYDNEGCVNGDTAAEEEHVELQLEEVNSKK